MDTPRKIFISYSHKDQRFVERFYQSVTRKVPANRFWLDTRSLKAGDSIDRKVQEALVTADYFVIVLSPNSVASTWVRDELEHAIRRSRTISRPYIIPILYKNCTIPPFLEGILYIDFRAPRQFNRSVEMFVNSIDHDSLGTASGPKTPGPITAPLFNDKIRELAAGSFEDESGQDYFRMLSDMPLGKLCKSAVLHRSYGGSFQQTSRDFISLFSNLNGGLHFNNLVILMGLFRDAGLAESIDADLIDFARSIVEDDSVGDDYKDICLIQLYEYYTGTDDIQLKKRCVPSIIPRFGFNAYLDKCISSAFSKKSSSLAHLWDMIGADGRIDLLDYIDRVSTWKGNYDSSKLHFESTYAAAIEKLRRHWIDISHPDRDYSDLTELTEILQSLKISHMGRFIEAVEVICWQATRSGDSSRMQRVIQLFLENGADQNIISKYGDAWHCHLLMNLITSPNVDTLISVFAFVALIMRYGFDPLEFEDRFPRGLVRRKALGTVEKYSVIEGLIEGIRTDSLPPIILLQILQRWEGRIFIWVAISHWIGSISDKDSNGIAVLRDVVDQKISFDDAYALLSEVEG